MNIYLLNSIGLPINDERFAKGDATAGTRWRVWRTLTAKHALKERGSLNELTGAREACRFPNDVLVQHRLHLVLSARAALTAGLACNAPSTETEAMVARASSGLTSWEMLARHRTLMCSISPARCTASRSSRLYFRSRRSRLFRAVDCLTTSA